jgi:hypothetical protein
LGWPRRLDPSLPRGLAVEKLFRETLKSAGNFDFVISTKIDKATVERPHFFIAYATKSADGLKTFRQTEYDALREHAKNRANAIEKKREQRLNATDMFAGHQAQVQEATIDEIVAEQKTLASNRLIETLAQHGPLKFSRIVAGLLQPYMLRETNVKDICVDLARAGKIENTWGDGNRKPRYEDMIKLKQA